MSGGYSNRYRTSDREVFDYATELRLQEKHDAIARNRKLSAETNKRRKILANKRKVEAQREEKRRQEILSKRREQQKFATERFQRSHVTKKKQDIFYTDSIPRRAVNLEPTPALEDALHAVRGSGHTRQNSQESNPSNNTVVPTDNPTNKLYYHKYGAYIPQRTPDRTKQHMKEIADRTELHYRSLSNLSNSRSLFEKQLQQSQQQLVVQHQRALDDLSAAATLGTEEEQYEEFKGSNESLCSADSLDSGKDSVEERLVSEPAETYRANDAEHCAARNDNDVLLEDANDSVSDILEEVTPSVKTGINTSNTNGNCNSKMGAYCVNKQQTTEAGLESRQAGSANVLSRRTQMQSNSVMSDGSRSQLKTVDNLALKAVNRDVGVKPTNKAWSTPPPDVIPSQKLKGTLKKSTPVINNARTVATAITEANVMNKLINGAVVPSDDSPGAVDFRSSYTISSKCEPVASHHWTSQVTSLASPLHKVSSEPVICAHPEDKDEDESSSTQSAPEQELKGILKRPQPSERRTVFTRQGSMSSPNIRDSIEVTKEHQHGKPVRHKKSVRFADNHHERLIESDLTLGQMETKKPPIVSIPAAVPRPTPPRMTTQQTPVVNKKPPRPVSAKVATDTREATSRPARSASAGTVRPGPMLKPKAGSPKTTQRTVYAGEEEEAEHTEVKVQQNGSQPMYNDRGLRLDKTPTDDEINWLWEKVRTCLNRSTSSTSGDGDSQPIRAHPAQAHSNQISANFTDNSHLNMNGTFPRRRLPSDNAHSNGSYVQRRQAAGQGNAGQLRPTQGSHRPQHSHHEPMMSHNHDVSESMAAFLTAEAMAQKSASEAEIQQAMDAAQNRQQAQLAGRPSYHVPSALSIEEQRLMQSLDRLNERLRVTDITSGNQPLGTPYEGDAQSFPEEDIRSKNKGRVNILHQRTLSAESPNNRRQRAQPGTPGHQRLGSGSLMRPIRYQ